jgi:hypothetical protein
VYHTWYCGKGHTEYKNTVFYIADIFKVFCTFANCFKTGSQGGLMKYAFESGLMFDRHQLGGSSVLEAY